jgi:hypothetical protein
MRTLKTSEAAALLNVSSNTLRAWEQRFAFPRPHRSPGGHRVYAYAEIDALRAALHGGLSAASAISVARESVTTDVPALIGALASFKRSRADSVMEAALGISSLERAVETLLLDALETLFIRKGAGSLCWAFGLRWATDWLRRAQRLVGSADGERAVIIVEALDHPGNLLSAHVHALELFCARGGFETVAVPAHAFGGLEDAIEEIRPNALVVAGSQSQEDVARWIYCVRSTLPDCIVACHLRRGVPGSASSVVWLPNAPSQAYRGLASALDNASVSKQSAPAQSANGPRPIRGENVRSAPLMPAVVSHAPLARDVPAR